MGRAGLPVHRSTARYWRYPAHPRAADPPVGRHHRHDAAGCKSQHRSPWAADVSDRQCPHPWNRRKHERIRLPSLRQDHGCVSVRWGAPDGARTGCSFLGLGSPGCRDRSQWGSGCPDRGFQARVSRVRRIHRYRSYSDNPTGGQSKTRASTLRVGLVDWRRRADVVAGCGPPRRRSEYAPRGRSCAPAASNQARPERVARHSGSGRAFLEWFRLRGDKTLHSIELLAALRKFDYSGHTHRIIGTATATTRISSGRPIRQ